MALKHPDAQHGPEHDISLAPIFELEPGTRISRHTIPRWHIRSSTTS